MNYVLLCLHLTDNYCFSQLVVVFLLLHNAINLHLLLKTTRDCISVTVVPVYDVVSHACHKKTTTNQSGTHCYATRCLCGVLAFELGQVKKTINYTIAISACLLQ